MHYLAILVATIASFIIGGIWYGPLFGKVYRNILNVPEGTDMHGADGRLPLAHAMVLRFLATLVITYVLSYFLVFFGAADILTALKLALVIWLGFMATVMTSSVLFEGRPVKFYLINAGNELLGLLIAAAVLFYLPW